MQREVSIERHGGTPLWKSVADVVAVEEPLEIRVEGEPLVIAMRTPGQDRELAAGWLLSEGVISHRDQIADIVCRPGDDPRAAMVDVMLRNPANFSVERHRRAAFSNASCGLCGAASVEQVLRKFPKIETAFLISASVLALLPEKLREQQAVFKSTGGLHACGLFDATGSLLAIREDVGRHNALDKLLGWALLEGKLPLSESMLLLSGRVSFEMMQKSLAGGIPIVAAIGAPSSLAVEVAERSGQCLVAFLRGETFNVYSHKARIPGTRGP